MTIKLFALTLSIFLLLSQPSFLLGQKASEQSDWTRVQALSAGVKLLIETKSGKSLKGTLNAVTDTALSLNSNNSAVSVNKDDIQKIYRLGGGSRAKSAIIGAAIGAGVGGGGAAIALATTGGSDDTTGILGKGIAIGAAAGALIGLLAGKGSRKTLIYESN